MLGKKNDGNVVLTLDQSGIEKANYGSFLGRIFTKVRKEPSNPVENAFLFAEIPVPSPDREEQFRKTILEANFFMRGTGGAVFSLNPETGAYTLVQSERLDRLDPKAFFALVEKFVNTPATWKGISASAQGEASVPSSDGAETQPLESFGFMQV